MKNPFIFFACITTFVLFIWLLFPGFLAAQPPLPPGPSATPIDGGLALLAAAGGAYAVKKLRDRKE